MGGVDWIDLAKDRNMWRDVVKTVTYLRVEQSAGNFLTNWATFSFSRGTSRPAVSRLIPSCPSAELPTCCYELHRQISGGVGCTGGRGPIIWSAEGTWRLDLLYAPRRRLKLGRFGTCRCYNDVFSTKHTALAVVNILTLLFVFGVTQQTVIISLNSTTGC